MNRKQKKNLCRIILASAMFISLEVLRYFLPMLPAWLYIIPYLTIGYDVLKKAFKGIRNKQMLDENFLMAIATIGAVLLSEYTESVAVMLFYQIGELFQSYAVGKSRRNIQALMDIRPDYANVLRNGETIRVSPDEVEVGETIRVNPGEKIPLDGIILEGRSSLDTSLLTGESVPRQITEGMEVLSGTVNITGVLKIKVSRGVEESTASRILELVENASSRKSRAENFISRFARIYTPFVVISALCLMIITPLFSYVMIGSLNLRTWIYRALTFLVISCPCALVISIPLSFFAGIGCQSREGILVKGSNYLEALSKTGIFVFDKTGTLTEGVFRVTGIFGPSGELLENNGFKEETLIKDRDAKENPEKSDDIMRLLEISSLLEESSSHPIARSIRLFCEERLKRNREKTENTENAVKKVSDIQEIPGRGVGALIDGKKALCGNRLLMLEEGFQIAECQLPGSHVYVSLGREYLGMIVISDTVKENSGKAILELKRLGKRIVMLTGDNKESAEKISSYLGIDEVYSSLLPADKVKKLEDIIEKKNKNEMLAFVGDGINDAPVLSRADIGIAMGAMGSDAAIEAADVVLMDDDPCKILKALRISSKCVRIVYENIIFSLVIKGLCLIFGALGIANMWWAIFSDVGVMILAVLNAVRALKIRE